MLYACVPFINLDAKGIDINELSNEVYTTKVDIDLGQEDEMEDSGEPG